MRFVVRSVALLLAAAVCALAGGAFAVAQSPQSDESRFDTYFRDKTMRVDYFHSGGPGGRPSRWTASYPTARGPAAARGWSTTSTSGSTSTR